MRRPDALDDLVLLVRSRYGLVHLRTEEDERAAALLRHLADALRVPFWSWTRTGGLVRADVGSPVYDTGEPLKAFRHVATASTPGVFHFVSPGSEALQGPVAMEEVQAAARAMSDVDGAVVLTGHGLELPPPVARHAATVDLPAPDAEEYRELLLQIVRDMSARGHVEVSLTPSELGLLMRHLAGLTLLEAEKVLTRAIVEDGRLTPDDVRHVVDHKKELVERDGLLEYYPAEAAATEVADLATLKAWLAKRKAVVRDPAGAAEFGLDFPKGMLLLGVPGCGKSLSAKAVAREWGLPLLKLDPSSLYNKYIGESEKNFRRAMAAAEAMSPVVLWIDELEKAFAAGGDEDGGVSKRILGTFLSWMQDRRGDVFVVATANAIRGLPPELLRKGRFDEIFFVDLPGPETRAEIFRIHLGRRGQEPGGFDVEGLAAATEGFSGSEIEEVVVAALYTAFAAGAALTDAHLSSEIAATRPLSSTMAERIAEMRAWARERTVRAN